MNALDHLIREPHLTEIDSALVRGSPARVWENVRHGALTQAWPVRALFALRSAFMRDDSSGTVCVDDMQSSEAAPGFQLLIDDPPRQFVVAAIGKVWQLRIPFVHVADVDAYAAFADPGYAKVAWAIRITPVEDRNTCRVEVELRVHATDEPAWRRFKRYFRVIAPFSRFIRRSLLRALDKEVDSCANGRGATLPRPSVHHRGV